MIYVNYLTFTQLSVEILYYAIVYKELKGPAVNLHKLE